jgi:hypothetical protein
VTCASSQETSRETSSLERWFRSRKRFWTFREARLCLPCLSASDARIDREGRWFVIRTSDGRYLLQGDTVDFPVGEEDEVSEMPDEVCL